jgi:hypothetical protein
MPCIRPVIQISTYAVRRIALLTFVNQSTASSLSRALCIQGGRAVESPVAGEENPLKMRCYNYAGTVVLYVYNFNKPPSLDGEGASL